MNLEDLKKLEEIADKTLLGPWFIEDYKNDRDEHGYYIIHDGKTGYGDDCIASTFLKVVDVDQDKKEEKANAEFISSLNEFISSLNPEVAKQLIKLARIGLASSELVDEVKPAVIYLEATYSNTDKSEPEYQMMIALKAALKKYREMMGE